MNNPVFKHLLRFLLLLIPQVLIFRRLEEAGGVFEYGRVFLYPLFILLLPLQLPTVALLGIAFLAGLSVDAFYDSPGVHAGALVLTAYARPLVLTILQPRDGYNITHHPTKYHLGIGWFLSYSSILMGVFLLAYFSLEAFTLVHLPRILLNSIASFVLSMFFIVILQYLFNPKS